MAHIEATEGSMSGARFHRCALQVNPHHYAGSFRGQSHEGNEANYVESIVEKAARTGVTVLAVTDHNSVADVPAFKRAATDRGIHVFPGFEIESSDGVHTLCIYPQHEDPEKLERYLGELGILEPGPSASLSRANFAEILEKVKEHGGITVAAHATGSKGLLKTLSGMSRIRAWQNEALAAIQIPGPVCDLPVEFRSIVENKNADYRRSHPAGNDLAVAVVNAKDISKPDDLDDASATCWIKMSEVSIEGLRQAFLDPDSRIRLNTDPEPEEHAEFLALSWEGGFLDGAAIRFNPNLNVMVGGRGAGKSTVIESLRYVLNKEAVGEDAQKAHMGMVRHVLRSGTKVSLDIRSHRPSKRDYRIERVVPNPPVVRDDSGQISNLLPRDILPGVEIYGQHEISEITRSPENLTSLLDRFVVHDETLNGRKLSVRRDLEQTRKAVLNTQSELDQIEERLAALPGLEETLERYREAGLEERLGEQSLLVKEERVLDTIPERLQSLRDFLESLRQELPIDRAFLSPKALEELPGREILSGGAQILERLSNELEQVANLLEEALNRAGEGFESVRERWNIRKEEVGAAYQKALRELQQSAVDGEEFIRLQREIEGLRPLRERRTLLTRLEREHSARRRTLLAEWEDVKAEESRLLDRAARSVGRKLQDRVQVAVTTAGNRQPLSMLLREEVGGRLSEAIEILEKVQDFSLPEFVASCREGVGAVQRKYTLPPAQAQRLAEASAESLMRIEELELPPTTIIKLNTATPGAPPVWQQLDDLSTGQKATAVLLLLLLESDAPLIVDQPEDDLDNRFITEGIVPKMREEKQRRQFIFSTHNANIPVLGDAELIVGLTPSGEGESDSGRAAIKQDHIGSIDCSGVRSLVEDILEGGKDAFETRRQKYGF